MLFDSSQVKLFGNEQISSNNKPEIIESTVDIEEENMEDGSASYLAEAGKFEIGDDPTVWILIILFNLAVAVAIERTIYLYKNRGNNSELVDILTTKLSERCNDCRELVEKVRDKIYGMEGRIAAKTLQGWNYGRETMNEFSKAAIESEKRLLDKRLIVLSTLGNNAPFIGLLGTVLGIMKAFRDLAVMGDAGPAVVMQGISEALVATAFGLGVAIPCVIAYNIFTNQNQNKLSNAEEIVNILSGMRSAFEVDNTEKHDNLPNSTQPIYTNQNEVKTSNNKDINITDNSLLENEVAV